MSDALIKWLVWIIGSLTIASGAIVFIAALFRDRSKGRERCPSCWYDMTGARSSHAAAPSPNLRCPECGHACTTPASLRRTRRRWGFALLGILICLLGYAGFIVRKGLVAGWTTAIPSTVLVVFWPLSEKDWLDGNFTYPQFNPTLAELDHRLQTGSLSRWQERWWTSRVRNYARTNRRLGVDAERATLARLNLATVSISQTLHSTDDLVRCVFESSNISISMPSETFDPPIDATSAPITAMDALLLGLDRSDSPSHHADARWLRWHLDGPRVVVIDAPDAGKFIAVHFIDTSAPLARIEERWNSLHAPSFAVPPEDEYAPCFQHYNDDDVLDHAGLRDELASVCEQFARPADWNITGRPFNLVHAGDTLVVQAPPIFALDVESLIEKLTHPIDPAQGPAPGSPDLAIAAALRTFEHTELHIDHDVHTVPELLYAVQSRSNLLIRDDFASASHALLDDAAMKRLSAPDASCAAALDEAARCVSESSSVSARWFPTPTGVAFVPDPVYVHRELRVYDLTSILNCATAGRGAATYTHAAIGALALKITTVDADDWTVNGGDIIEYRFLGTYLIVSAPMQTQIGVQRLLAATPFTDLPE